MISHEHKCIFIHIPKCAGTSIESALGHLDGHEGRSGQDHRTIRMIEQPSLNPYILSSRENIKEYFEKIKHRMHQRYFNKKNTATVTPKQYENYFKFSVVRNPWARAFSWYKNVMRDETHLKNLRIDSEITFSEFLKENIGKGMLKQQTHWLKNYRGQIQLDYIGRFENLQDTFNEVRDRLNLPNIIFPHKIQGSADNYQIHFDKPSIELIEELYREEIQLFDYCFEGNSQAK